MIINSANAMLLSFTLCSLVLVLLVLLVVHFCEFGLAVMIGGQYVSVSVSMCLIVSVGVSRCQ